MRRRGLAAGLAAALALPLATGAPGADEERRPKPETRRVQAVGEWAYQQLTRAHELLAAEKHAEVLQVLDRMAARKGLNEHEQALMWQTYGYAWSSQERYREATEAFEKCLALDALPEGAALTTRYNLGQLYLAREQYAEALSTLRAWFDEVESPAPDAHHLLAVAYVENGQPGEALPHAKQAVAGSDAPEEAWLQLLLSLHFEREEYREVAAVLEQLVARFPKKTYWLQLAAAWGELGEDRKALAALELAHLQGLLTSDSELMNLAQRYLFHELPYQAARLLEKGLADGSIEEDAGAWELLANAWLHARERERALAPLARAAALAADGDLYVQLAQIRIEREEWSEARAALVSAFAKGGLSDPGDARLLLGIAHYGEGEVDAARSAFGQAAAHEKSQKAATQWLAVLEREAALSPARR